MVREREVGSGRSHRVPLRKGEKVTLDVLIHTHTHINICV